MIYSQIVKSNGRNKVSMIQEQSEPISRKHRMMVLLHEYKRLARLTMDTSKFRKNGEEVTAEDVIEVLNMVNDFLYDTELAIKE